MKKILFIILFISMPISAALDKDRCGASIVTGLKAINTGISGPSEAALLPYWIAICDKIILEIQTNMDVTTTVTVPGVTPGPASVVGTGSQTSIQ